MHAADEFLKSLALVLCVAAVTTVVFQRFHQPVVLGYLLAGVIVGPHVPIPLVADKNTVQTLAELGVILLMFSLGLEFSLRKVLRLGPMASIIAIVEVSIMLCAGFLVARGFGWTVRESVYTGAIISISSTTIIVRAFEEQRAENRVREIVFGVLIVEDLVAILLMATLTAVSSRQGVSIHVLARTAGRLATFLAVLLAGGMLLIPRAVRAVVRLNRPETTLVSSIGLCFAVALLARALGYSVAFGAFLAGSLVAESGKEQAIEPLVRPVRDIFAAVFFVAVGMLIDPALVADHWVAVVMLVLVVVVGKVVGVSLGAFLTGNNARVSIQAGMSMAQIGEFSFIIASLGLSLHAIGEFLYPVAIAVSAITTLLTPWLLRASVSVADFVDRILPAPLQTFVALYGQWVEQLRASPRRVTTHAQRRRVFRLLVADAVALAAVVISTSRFLGLIESEFARRTGLAGPVVHLAVLGVAGVVATPLCVGIVRLAHRLGAMLAETALPAVPAGKLDLAAAPRRALVVTLQLACVLLVGVPLVAVTEPFLRISWSLAVLAVLVGGLGIAFWRSATNLQGHVRAGVQVIVDALAAQSGSKNAPAERDALSEIQQVLPGLGRPTPFQLTAASPAVGQTLAHLNLRGLTGATVLAIQQGTVKGHVPTAQEVLQAGDVLVLTGTDAAIDAACRILAGDASTYVEKAAYLEERQPTR